MHFKRIFQLTLVLIGALVTSQTFADSTREELEFECVYMGGELVSRARCEVISETEESYEEIVRPSGKSGRGWSRYATVVTTTKTNYFTKRIPRSGGMWTAWEEGSKVVISEDILAEGCLNPAGKDKGQHKHCGF